MNNDERRRRAKGRKSTSRYFGLPLNVANHEAYYTLSDGAKSMLTEIGLQYSGNNNGDLAATLTQLKHRGWNSNSKIRRTVLELIRHGLIKQARQGGRHKCNLYALTWKPIDDCKGKPDIPPTSTASNEWKQFRFSLHLQEVQCTPPGGSIHLKVVNN